MNERQPEADLDRRESLRGSRVGGSQNDHQEHKRQHHFSRWRQIRLPSRSRLCL
jgi:hypothetical protein